MDLSTIVTPQSTLLKSGLFLFRADLSHFNEIVSTKSNWFFEPEYDDVDWDDIDKLMY